MKCSSRKRPARSSPRPATLLAPTGPAANMPPHVSGLSEGEALAQWLKQPETGTGVFLIGIAVAPRGPGHSSWHHTKQNHGPCPENLTNRRRISHGISQGGRGAGRQPCPHKPERGEGSSAPLALDQCSARPVPCLPLLGRRTWPTRPDGCLHSQMWRDQTELKQALN